MSKLYDTKSDNKSIFSKGDLYYLFNVLNESENEPMPNNGGDDISLAKCISGDDDTK